MLESRSEKGKEGVFVQPSFFFRIRCMFACLVHLIKCEIIGPTSNTVLFGWESETVSITWAKL